MNSKNRSRKTIIIILMSVFIIFGIISIVAGIATNVQVKNKLEYYETVKAKIIDYRVEVVGGHGKGQTTKRHYYPIYSYKVDGEKYEYESRVSRTSKAKGSQIIYYDPDDPSSVITAEEKNSGVILLLAGGMFLIVGTAALIGVGISSKKKEKNVKPFNV